MSTPKTIAVVGVSEETTAFLRLLLRKLAAKSTTKWVWGNEDAADLVVIDPTVLVGEGARIRAESSGVHYAVLLEADAKAEDPLVLRHPLDAEQLAAVLAVAGAPRKVDAAISHADENFYEQQAPSWPEPELQSPRGDAFAERLHQAKAAMLGVGAVEGLEVVIKRDKEQRAQPDYKQLKLDEVTVEGITDYTVGYSGRRAESKVVDRGDMSAEISNARDGALMRNSALIGGASEKEEGEMPFFLSDDVLGGPAQIQLASAPALTLDPKNEVFHADASLSALEPYCRGKLQRASWKKVMTADLNSVRAAAPSRPYWHLSWLHALLQSNGRLGTHLDPGGTYRLKEQVFVEPGYRSHGVIAAVMDHPLRLNEISATAKVRMESVFDFINAYDAVGKIEWTPRQRLSGQQTIDEKQKGILDRLKWPFGKK